MTRTIGPGLATTKVITLDVKAVTDSGPGAQQLSKRIVPVLCRPLEGAADDTFQLRINRDILDDVLFHEGG